MSADIVTWQLRERKSMNVRSQKSMIKWLLRNYRIRKNKEKVKLRKLSGKGKKREKDTGRF